MSPLEQDLLRRDLTINAIAQDKKGRLFDPYNGLGDLQNKTLRHVSEAFVEDPVRILRVARFSAKLAPLGFKLAPETLHLMQEMVNNGEVSALVPERVWQELHKALSCKRPSYFIQRLKECGALKFIMPEVNQLFGIPQTEQYHPEIDTGLHTLMTLDRARALTSDTRVSFAALCHDLGKRLKS